MKCEQRSQSGLVGFHDRVCAPDKSVPRGKILPSELMAAICKSELTKLKKCITILL